MADSNSSVAGVVDALFVEFFPAKKRLKKPGPEVFRNGLCKSPWPHPRAWQDPSRRRIPLPIPFPLPLRPDTQLLKRSMAILLLRLMNFAVVASAQTASTTTAIPFAAWHRVLAKPVFTVPQIGAQYLLGVSGQKSMNLDAQSLEISLPLPRQCATQQYPDFFGE